MIHPQRRNLSPLEKPFFIYFFFNFNFFPLELPLQGLNRRDMAPPFPMKLFASVKKQQTVKQTSSNQ